MPKTKTHILTCKRHEGTDEIWLVYVTDDQTVFPNGLALVSIDHAKKLVLFDHSTKLGPPWIDLGLQLWLGKLNYNAPPEQAHRGKFYFFLEELGIIEEIPGKVLAEFSSYDTIHLTIELDLTSIRSNSDPLISYSYPDSDVYSERRYSLAKPDYGDKLKEILDTLNHLRTVIVTMEARILSIERDDYLEKEEFTLLKLLAANNFQGLIALLILLFSFQTFFVENTEMKRVIIDWIGAPQRTIDPPVNSTN